MNIFYDKFSAGQVVAATGVSNPTLQSWMKRGFIVGARESGQSVVGGGTPGSHRMFSFFNVMEVAIAKGLLDAGLGDLETAFHAACRFAHFGHGAVPPHNRSRHPSLPYHAANMSGETLLFVRGEWSEVVLWQVGQDVLPSIFYRRGGCVLIEVDPIFDRVVAALGYHPVAVLSLAYGEADVPSLATPSQPEEN